MTKLAVTVLIPTYNRAHFLSECLDSVLGQTLPPAQVIVINDGSTDKTKEVLDAYSQAIEYIETENGGKSRALNLALTRVAGDYVWIVDDDNVAFPDGVEKLVGVLERDAALGFAYSGYWLAGTRTEDNRIDPWRKVSLPEFPEEEILPRLTERNFVICPMVRTSCYTQVGPYREDLIRSQDYEMALRLARHARGGRVNEPTFYFRKHGGLRGSARDRFDAKENFWKWREYDKSIFRELRRELDLSEYLPRNHSWAALGPNDTRRAFLQRMTSMALKGLYDEMLEDLGLALANEAEPPGLSEPERLLISRALSYAPADDALFTGSMVLPRVKALCRGSALGSEVQFEFLRGIYWRGYSAWTHRSIRHAFRFLLAFIRCAGFTGIARALSYKLTRAPGADIDSTQNH